LNINLTAGNTITDLGCGPLTFVSALWITRPDLRSVPLEFNCIDRVFPVLEAGKKFFSALGESTWKINLIKKDINIQKTDDRGSRKNASLVCTVNLFNEIHERVSHNNTEALRLMAANAARYMHSEAAKDASILTVEPGVPQSGRFISLLRSEFINLGRKPASPCTHEGYCPLLPHKHGSSAKKERWCHFAFEASDTPKDLQNLSKAAKLPKERLVFSFLLTGTASAEGKIRVISDAFPLPGNRFGRYGCSGEGLILLAGEKKTMENACSLSLVEQGRSAFDIIATEERDAKSGALIYEVK